VSDLSNTPAGEEQPPYVPPTAGSQLRAAREAAGLDIDVVAQHLKLAPRQVRALEDDDYAALPGRTFVRGFVRNYARLLQLDTDDVVALLPGADVAPSLERPTITPSGRPMGHLPADAPVRRTWTRWVIPLALIAIVIAAGVYEFRRASGDTRRTTVDKSAAATVPGGASSTASLPNPLTSASEPAATNASAGDAAGTSAAGAPSTPGMVADNATAAGAPAVVPANATAPAATATSLPGAVGSSAAPAGEPMLVLTFRRSSWVQVKDRNGTTLLAQTAPAGSTQAVSGALPLDLVIGNAPDVQVTFRGQPVDLAPHVRANVARISLK
jgi:cytoskeleton protein RodZ